MTIHLPSIDTALILPEGLIARHAQTSSDVAMIWLDQPLDQVDPARITGPYGVEQVPGIELAGLQCINLARYIALVQFNPYWIRPTVGSSVAQLSAIEHQINFLLWQDHDKQFHVMLPLIGEGFRVSLLGDGAVGLTVDIELDTAAQSGPLLAVAHGTDPYNLLQTTAKVVADELHSFRLRQDKPVPPFVDLLGWCTWDAFYHEVNQDKLVEGLESFTQGGIVPPLVVLDDGWLTKDDQSHLCSFEPDPTKFPDGLESLIRRIKQQYGVKMFGIWHTLSGYWNGVAPDSALAKEYCIAASADPLRRSDGVAKSHGHAVSVKDISRFYHDFYTYLRRVGIDLTKVDNQNAQANYADDVSQRAKMVRSYQQAYQAAAWTHFLGNTIHCMCNRNDIAYNMSATTVWRNSNDYFPNRDGSHQCHLYYNAMNSLWTSLFAIPDWDMFWSGAQTGAFHAAARAISGGPVYLSDKPGEQNFEILRKLCTSEGHVLRCPQPALPTEDCLFTDFMDEPKLLKVFNSNGNTGVLGLFHCLWAETPDKRKTITDHFMPSDVHQLAGEFFAVYQHQSQNLCIAKRDEQLPLTLDFREFEIVTIAPLHQGVAMLGLLDKYNGSAAIVSEIWLTDNHVRWELADGGTIGLVSQRPIEQAILNGQDIKLNRLEENDLLTINVPNGQSVVFQLLFVKNNPFPES